MTLAAQSVFPAAFEHEFESSAVLKWQYKFNQWLLFHSLLLLALCLLLRTWMPLSQVWILSLASVLPLSVFASMLLPYRVNRYSLSALFCIWMLLWMQG